MEQFTYENEEHGLKIRRIIGVIILAICLGTAIILWMWIPDGARFSIFCMFPACIGLFMFMTSRAFDNSSFLVRQGFAPSQTLGEDGIFAKINFSYDKDVPLVCVSKKTRIGKYDVVYYRPDEVDVRIEVTYTVLHQHKRVSASGAEKAAAFTVGGLPLAAAVTAMGKKKIVSGDRVILKVMVYVIPHDNPESGKHAMCLYKCPDRDKLDVEQGQHELNQAKDYQKRIAEDQSLFEGSRPPSTSIEWIRWK